MLPSDRVMSAKMRLIYERVMELGLMPAALDRIYRIFQDYLG